MRVDRTWAAFGGLGVWLILSPLFPAEAQMRTPGVGAVSEDVGPIGDPSQPVGAGSGSMHGSGTIGESSEPVHSGPVRDATTRSMHSGPVSSMSRGPMTQPQNAPVGGSMTEASSGAVKHDLDRPLGSRISQPLRELAPLQEQLRRLRLQGDTAAIEAAGAPPAAGPEEAAPEIAVPTGVAPDHLPPQAAEAPPEDTADEPPTAASDGGEDMDAEPAVP